MPSLYPSYDPPPDLTAIARALRKEPTAAEAVLWTALRDRTLGVRFRRQHPIGDFVTDFYCHGARLVVEVDGSIHDEPEIAERDRARQAWIQTLGPLVIRFKNEEVLRQLPLVLREIDIVVAERIGVRGVPLPRVSRGHGRRGPSGLPGAYRSQAGSLNPRP